MSGSTPCLEILDEVDSALLMRHVTEISAVDRESGEPGDWQAAEYVVSYLRKHDIPARVERIKNLISMPASARIDLPDGRQLPCLTHAYAASTGIAGLQAELVALRSAADTVSVTGKIAVLPGLATPKASNLLERRGAAGLIFVNSGEYVHNMAISPIWGMPTRADLSSLAQIPVVSVNCSDGRTLTEAIKAGSMYTARMTTQVNTGFREIPLVIADIVAMGATTSRYVLFNGHIDSWHRGALDNATANAAMLEIARILSRHRQSLTTNIRIVWWSGHSNGRYSGSDWYADHNWEDVHNNAVVNFNIDSIGASGATHYGRVDSSAQCFDVGWQAIHSLTGQDPRYSRIARNGDQSFWGHGVPSLFQVLSLQPPESQRPDTFVPGLPWYWHTSQDLPEHIAAPVLTLDCKIYLQAILAFVTGTVYPFRFAPMLTEIVEHLSGAQKSVRDAYDFAGHLALASRLEETARWFDAKVSSTTDAEIGEYIKNAAMQINRIVMPVHYCAVGPFHTDDALPSQPFPGLADLELLHRHPSELEFEAHRREIVRESNRIRHMLIKLDQLLTSVRRDLKG